MSIVPVITSPCPFRWNSAPTPGQDFCGQCERQVHNLDLMSAAQRNEFMQSCSGKVCVSYSVTRTITVKNVALGIGLAAGIASSGIGAQEAGDMKLIESRLTQSVTEWKASEREDVKEIETIVLLGGTVLDPETSRWVDESEIEFNDAAELPISTEMQWLATPKK